MFERIVRFAIEQRWLVLLAVLAMAALSAAAVRRCCLFMASSLSPPRPSD